MFTYSKTKLLNKLKTTEFSLKYFLWTQRFSDGLNDPDIAGYLVFPVKELFSFTTERA